MIKQLFKALFLLIIGGFIIFPIVFVLGVFYTTCKHFIKLDYSLSKQFIPVIQSITFSSDGLANAGAGELLNDALNVKTNIRYGNWSQTISAVTGLRLIYNKEDNWLRRLLTILGKTHSQDAITIQEKFYYSNNNH